MSVCWLIGSSNEFLAKGPGPCGSGYVEYSGDIVYAPDGETLQMTWDPAAGLPRPFTAVEALSAAKSAKSSALAASLEPYFNTQWNEVERFLAANPATAAAEWMDVYGAHRLACAQAVAAAIAAVNAAATSEAVNAVAITWPATPEKPQ